MVTYLSADSVSGGFPMPLPLTTILIEFMSNATPGWSADFTPGPLYFVASLYAVKVTGNPFAALTLPALEQTFTPAANEYLPYATATPSWYATCFSWSYAAA